MTKVVPALFLLSATLAAGVLDVSNDVFVTVGTGDTISFYAGARISGPGYLYFTAGGLPPLTTPEALPGSSAQSFPGFVFTSTVESPDAASSLAAGGQPLLLGNRSSHGYSGPIGTVSLLEWLPEPAGWRGVRLRNAGAPFTFGYPGYPLKHVFELIPPGAQYAGAAGGGPRRVEVEHVPEPGTAVLWLIGLALLNARLLFSSRRSANR